MIAGAGVGLPLVDAVESHPPAAGLVPAVGASNLLIHEGELTETGEDPDGAWWGHLRSEVEGQAAALPGVEVVPAGRSGPHSVVVDAGAHGTVGWHLLTGPTLGRAEVRAETRLTYQSGTRARSYSAFSTHRPGGQAPRQLVASVLAPLLALISTGRPWAENPERRPS